MENFKKFSPFLLSTKEKRGGAVKLSLDQATCWTNFPKKYCLCCCSKKEKKKQKPVLIYSFPTRKVRKIQVLAKSLLVKIKLNGKKNKPMET